MANIVNIPISKLYHHPNNRTYTKDGLAEMAESIRINGIFQNLTVVPYNAAEHSALQVSDPADAFVVVIGNRRRDAAEIAGLAEAPCVVAQMDLRGQIKTMAQENSLRKDMTPREEATICQLMLDLGDSIDSISQTTGFSTQTIRNRLSLLKLDSKKMEEAENRNVSMTDYLAISKLKYQDLRDSVLEQAGSTNFHGVLLQAQATEQNREILAKVRPVIESFATICTERPMASYIASYGNNYTKEVPEVPADKDTRKYYFFVNYPGTNNEYITLYGEYIQKPKTPEEIAKKALEEKYAGDDKLLKAATARAYELRKEFIKHVSATTARKNLGAIVSFLGQKVIEKSREQYGHYLNNFANEKSIADFLDIPYKRNDKEIPMEQFLDAFTYTPEYALLVQVYLSQEEKDQKYYCMRWNDKMGMQVPTYKQNDTLDGMYAFLGKLGYVMSDEEKALQDGSHELYWKESETASEDAA